MNKAPKRLANMQPYFLPYIGYFQLMAAVDKFVIFDDVNYINRGWINRNCLLMNGKAHTFTVPLRAASQNKLICEIELLDEQHWRDKLLRTMYQAYGKAAYYKQTDGLLERVINYPTTKLDEFLLNSLCEIKRHLSLEVEIIKTSRIFNNSELKAQMRILDICRQEFTSTYINPVGGLDLYDKLTFSKNDIQLLFIKTKEISCQNLRAASYMSIIETLVFNDRVSVKKMLYDVDFFRI